MLKPPRFCWWIPDVSRWNDVKSPRETVEQRTFPEASRRPTSMACAAVSSKPTFAWASAWWAASPSAWSWPRPSFCRRWGWFGWVEADFSPIDEDLADAGFALKGFHGMIRMDLGLSKTWIDQQNVVQRSTIWILICQFIWNIIYPDIGWFHSTWRWYLWISLYWGFGDGNFNHQPDDSATVRTVHQSPNSAHNLLIQIQKPLDV
jgi:hypothetical protein